MKTKKPKKTLEEKKEFKEILFLTLVGAIFFLIVFIFSNPKLTQFLQKLIFGQ